MSSPALTSAPGNRREAWLYILQRLSALVMAPLVVVHLVVIMIAVRGGLTAEEILGRTQSSLLWPTLYGLFVLAAAVHGAIGLRTVAREMLSRWRALPDLAAVLFLIAVLALGYRAVAVLA